MNTQAKNRGSKKRPLSSPRSSRRKAPEAEILFHTTVRLSPTEKRSLLLAAHAALAAIPKSVRRKCTGDRPLPLNLSIVTPAKMRTLNHQYRGKNRPTDVLAFSRVEHRTPGVPLVDLGDVIVCRSVAVKQAKENGILLAVELIRLTVHGVLHIFGYDHERSKAEEKKMFRLQEKIVQTLVRQSSPQS